MTETQIQPTTHSEGGPLGDGERVNGPLAGDGAELMERHVAGDPTAFARLVKDHASSVYGYLSRCGVASAERDDLFQDIFAKVHGSAHRFELSRPFRPWLFRIAVNTVRSYFRARRVRSSVTLLPVLDGVSSHRPSPQALMEARETARWLEGEVSRLPLQQREALILCCVERLPQRDAAAALDIPVNTLKTHLRRARLSIAQAMARRRLRLDRESTQ